MIERQAAIRDAAARCLDDPAYALALLDGEDHAEVRAAIRADLHDANAAERFLTPQPVPPGLAWWHDLPRAHLLALAGRRLSATPQILEAMT